MTLLDILVFLNTLIFYYDYFVTLHNRPGLGWGFSSSIEFLTGKCEALESMPSTDDELCLDFEGW
jgi:hypothetical protein